MQKKYKGLLGGSVVLLLGIILAIGIYKKETNLSEEVTRYQWIEMLCEHSGMIEYENEEPYFPDVSRFDEHFSYVQSACEWNLIKRSIKFRGEDIATGEFVVVTAMKSLGDSKLQALFSYDKALSDDELLSLAVKNDVIARSNLKKSVNTKTCLDILDKVDALNYGKILGESINEIRLKEGIIEISNSDIEGHSADYSEVNISNEIAENLTKSDAVVLEDENGIKFIKKVVDIRKDKLILGNGVDIDDVLEGLVVYETHEIEFKDIAQFYRFDDSERLISGIATDRRYSVTDLNSQKENNKGFKLGICSEENKPIEISITDNSTEKSYILPMPEDIKLGASFNAEVDVQKIICTPYIDYNAVDGVRYAEVALDVEADMRGELDIPMPDIEPIPLFTFTIPLANGFAQVDIQIYMQIEADGSVSFSAKVPIQSGVCYEKEKGVRRINREVEFEKPTINANCSLETGVHFQSILTILKCLEIMEAQLEVGITAEAESVTRINEQTCIDIDSAYPIVSISIGADEDRKNLLTMLDISKEWEIVSAEEAPFQFHMHWEALADGKKQFVDRCTYKGEKVEKKQEQKLSVENDFNNTYYTKYSEYNQCDRPTFCFDYPDNWTITEETVSEIIIETSYGDYYGEIVELEDENGIVITYTQWEMEPSLCGNGSAFDYIVDYEIENICDANIMPLELGESVSSQKYMVAKITEKGCMNPDGQYSEYNTIFYAIVPENALKEGEIDMVGFQGVTAFNYLTPYSFVASSLDGKLTEEKEEEIIQILSSFRLADKKESTKKSVTSKEVYEQLLNGDFSYYAGTYFPVYSYNSETDIVLQNNGIIKGGCGDYYTFPEVIPQKVIKNEDGTYLCQLLYESEDEQSYYIIYPPGVVKDTFEYAEDIIENKVLLEEAFFIYYIRIDGGVGDCLYYRLPTEE